MTDDNIKKAAINVVSVYNDPEAMAGHFRSEYPNELHKAILELAKALDLLYAPTEIIHSNIVSTEAIQ